MIKHPALRVRSVKDIYKPFLLKMAKDCEDWGALTPFSDLIQDFQLGGSYARDCAELHSDVDLGVKFASEAALLEALARIRQNPDGYLPAIAKMNALRVEYGCLLSFTLFEYDMATTPKSYYSMREQKMYEGNKRRLDKQPDGSFTERIRPRLRPPHLDVGVDDENWPTLRRSFDKTKDTPDMYDPWFAELPVWEKRYGAKLLKYGETEETSWMK